jgi:hypothetical protein
MGRTSPGGHVLCASSSWSGNSSVAIGPVRGASSPSACRTRSPPTPAKPIGSSRFSGRLAWPSAGMQAPARPWRPACSTGDRRSRQRRAGRPWRSHRPRAWCPSHPRIRATAGRAAAAGQPLGRHLCGRAAAAGAGDSPRHHGPATGPQSPAWLGLPPPRHAAWPQTAAAAVIRPGVDSRRALPAPPLAGEWGRQPATLAGDAGPRLHPLGPDGRPLYDSAAPGRRRGTAPRVAALVVHAPPGAVRAGGVLGDGRPGRQTVR